MLLKVTTININVRSLDAGGEYTEDCMPCVVGLDDFGIRVVFADDFKDYEAPDVLIERHAHCWTVLLHQGGDPVVVLQFGNDFALTSTDQGVITSEVGDVPAAVRKAVATRFAENAHADVQD